MHTAGASKELRADQPPFSGIRVLRVYATEQSQVLVESDDPLPEDRELKITWDWRIIAVPEFEVKVGVTLGPSGAAPETVTAAVVARFVAGGLNPKLTVRAFARYHALSFLLPYVREIITSLTARGPHGAVVLPPIYAQQVAETFDEGLTTAAKQAEADASIRSFYEAAGMESRSV